MKLWSVAIPRDNLCIGGLLGIGLAVLAAMSPVFAEEAAEAKVAAAPAAKGHAAKPTVPAGPAECLRTGQRVIAALARDDSGAASQFFTFYTAFKCPQQHLAQAFGCLVNLQTANPGLSNPAPEQVKQCWDEPGATPKIQSQQQPAPEAAGEKK